MEQYQIIAKLNALYNTIAARLESPRSRFFDPVTVLELFERYAILRDTLRSQMPPLFGDLPEREIPSPSKTTDFEGRGYITRQPLEFLMQDIKYVLDIIAATPTVNVPSMKITKEGVFFSGQYFDALRQVAEIVSNAKNSIILIDGYIGPETLDVLSGKKDNVTVQILTKQVSNQLKVLAQAFQKQYSNLKIRLSQAFHDRFLIIDDKEFYHFGASIKDLGKRGFMFSVIEEPDVISNISAKFQGEWKVAKNAI